MANYYCKYCGHKSSTTMQMACTKSNYCDTVTFRLYQYKRCLSLMLLAIVAFVAHAASNVPFSLSGLQNGDRAVVTISSDACLMTFQATADGNYSFENVPEGKHYIKVEAKGYNLPDSKIIVVNSDGSIYPFDGIAIVITKMSDNKNEWIHEWHEDGSVSGYTTTAYVNTPVEIEVLGKKIVPSDVPSQSILKENYGIVLADDNMIWTQEYAYRLLETIKTVPNSLSSEGAIIMTLTGESITDDINVESVAGGKLVTISKDAFVYANPFLVTLDGVRGRFFSKRLHHALVKLVTDFGKDSYKADRILSERFGCTIHVGDITALTGEDAANFQSFYPSELTAIINMLEELPEGFHKTAQLKYLVRRQDGHRNPRYPEAAAVSWCTENGYIEFINAPYLGVSAFGGNNEQFDTQRLILHEKTHFLWAFAFSDEIKNDWAEIGGWYRDPNSDSGWSTTKTTEFVSAYAHANNPNEDMAESVAFYLKNPEALRLRSLPKYEFIRDRIMHGTRYISHIPDHLTFEVLNLWPDYDYPGKIKKVKITVNGAPEEDKQLTFDIELNHIEGFDDGASSAFTRIMSPTFIDEEGNKKGTYIDLSFWPVDNNPWHLRGTATINKYSKAGYWVPGDISVNDAVGNARYEGRNDCITNIYVNNPLEDLVSPVYEKGSLRYELRDVEIGGHHEQILSVKFKAYDNVGIKEVAGGLYTGVDSNHMPGWNTIVDKKNKTIEIQYRIKDYFYTTDYYIASIFITDIGGLDRDIRFSDNPQHEPVQKIHITTPNPDYEHAELDLNRIYVHAEPTHPEAPDGETVVNVTFYARDNIAGLVSTGIGLRDPQGLRHFYSGPSVPTDGAGYFVGDPTAWKKYNATIILPQGSAPGIWGVGEINLRDLAYNDFTYNFVETLIFEPDDSETDYVLFADIDDNDCINLNVESDTSTGYGYTYRVISDSTGVEINGAVNVSKQISERQMINKAATRATGNKIDISSWPDGKVIVIVNILDNNGNVLATRSKTLVKSSGSTGIESIVEDGNVPYSVEYYTISGIRISHPNKGVNIIKKRYDNGVVKTMTVVKNF